MPYHQLAFLKLRKLDECERCFECFFDALRYCEDDAQPLAPALEELSLKLSNGSPQAGVEEMLRSRWLSDEKLLEMAAPPRVARWKKLYIDISVTWSEDFKSWTQVASRQGLELDYH